jgi:RNA polymerase primary sigma factor
MDLKEIKGIMTTSVRQVSVDAPFDNEDGGTLLDVMSDDSTESTDKNVEYNESLSIETERALSILSERERKILKLFFGIGIESPMTLDQIGEIMGTTRERVRQIKEKALKKMRASSKAGQLAEYLG